MLVNWNYQAYKFDPHHPLLKDPTDRATGTCVYSLMLNQSHSRVIVTIIISSSTGLMYACA